MRAVSIVLIVIDLLAGLSALVGAIGLVTGFMNIPLNVLQGTPFSDFTVPAILLGGVVGGSALAAALTPLFDRQKIFALISGLAGCIMVGWMLIEIAMIGFAMWVQGLYLVVGFVMIVLAAILWFAASRRDSASGRAYAA